MTIANREWNNRYANFLRCAEEAPEGTFSQAKAIAGTIGALADQILESSRQIGAPICNGDGIRNIEVVIYQQMVANNPEANEIAAAEGFGMALTGPAAARVLKQAERDRDFLRSFRPEVSQ